LKKKELKFIKYDNDKTNLAILFDTPTALEDIAKVMEYGAKKYDRLNWSKVEDKERYIAAALRHISAYAQGEVIDIESGLPHLAHACTSLMFVAQIEED
jgi:long-subunit acyl-CoA synthetase (AMP-forming)